MPQVQVQKIRNGYFSVRKGNRKPKVSFLAQGNRLFLACSTALVFVAFALAFVWTNYQAIQMGYLTSNLHQERTQMIELNRKLKVELANLSSLDRLEKTATKDLGLVTPKPEQLQVVE